MNQIENSPCSYLPASSTSEFHHLELQLKDIRKRATQSFDDFSIHEYEREDLVQETVIRLYQKLCHFPETHPAPFEHYINRTIRRRKLDYRRKKMNRQRIFDLYMQSTQYQNAYKCHVYENPVDAAIYNDMLCSVNKEAFRTFTPIERQVCEYLYQEWKPAEIAREMALPPKKIYNTIYRVREKLKAVLHVNVD